jgi:hypothetical protein
MILTRKIPIFDVEINFIDTPEDAIELINRLSATPDPCVDEVKVWRGFCHTVTDAKGKDHRMMCVFDRETTLNTVVHESVHAAWMMLRHCSMKVAPNNGEEPLAYMTAWFAEEMLKFLNSKEIAA